LVYWINEGTTSDAKAGSTSQSSVSPIIYLIVISRLRNKTEMGDGCDPKPGRRAHSDQGSQYMSHAYHDMLPKVGAQIIMSRRGNCLDNASMESFFSHLKTEGLYP